VKELLEYICKKNPDGIPYPDAVQVILWIYCTLDVLPEEFQELPLTRTELSKLFAKLGAVGLIRETPEAGRAGKQVFRGEWSQDRHWDAVIINLLRGELVLDDGFRTRIKSYV
jgi:hypothetical protein